jgi:hypothetical protein
MNQPLPIETLLPSLAGGGRVKTLVRRGMEMVLGVRGVRRLVDAGRNPWWFQLPGMFHPLLRSALLLPAFPAGRGRTVRCAAGRLIRPEDLREMDIPAATLYLRAAVAAIPLTI